MLFGKKRSGSGIGPPESPTPSGKIQDEKEAWLALSISPLEVEVFRKAVGAGASNFNPTTVEADCHKIRALLDWNGYFFDFSPKDAFGVLVDFANRRKAGLPNLDFVILALGREAERLTRREFKLDFGSPIPQGLLPGFGQRRDQIIKELSVQASNKRAHALSQAEKILRNGEFQGRELPRDRIIAEARKLMEHSAKIHRAMLRKAKESVRLRLGLSAGQEIPEEALNEEVQNLQAAQKAQAALADPKSREVAERRIRSSKGLPFNVPVSDEEILAELRAMALENQGKKKEG